MTSSSELLRVISFLIVSSVLTVMISIYDLVVMGRFLRLDSERTLHANFGFIGQYPASAMSPMELRELWTASAMLPVGSFVVFVFFGMRLDVTEGYVVAGRWLSSKLSSRVAFIDLDVQTLRQQ